MEPGLNRLVIDRLVIDRLVEIDILVSPNDLCVRLNRPLIHRPKKLDMYNLLVKKTTIY